MDYPSEQRDETSHPPTVGRPLDCHRQISRQATSAVAYTAEPPAPGDPLLDFAPVPHARPRRNSITPDLQRKFIAHLAATGIVTAAARHIGKSMEALCLFDFALRRRARAIRLAWLPRQWARRAVALAVGWSPTIVRKLPEFLALDRVTCGPCLDAPVLK